MQHNAYGVSITTSRIKTDNPNDHVNFGVKIKTTKYYVGSRGRTTNQQYLATFLTKELAEKLAAKLATAEVETAVIELNHQPEDHIYSSLEELGETSSLTDLQVAVRLCMKEIPREQIVQAVVVEMEKT